MYLTWRIAKKRRGNRSFKILNFRGHRSWNVEKLYVRGVVFRKTMDTVSASSRYVDPESSLETINGGFYITGLAVLESRVISPDRDLAAI